MSSSKAKTDSRKPDIVVGDSNKKHDADISYRPLSNETKSILRQEAIHSGAALATYEFENAQSDLPRSQLTESARGSRGWFRLGFVFAVFVACSLTAVYRQGEMISESLPSLSTSIASYSEFVERGIELSEDSFQWLPGMVDALMTATREIVR